MAYSLALSTMSRNRSSPCWRAPSGEISAIPTSSTFCSRHRAGSHPSKGHTVRFIMQSLSDGGRERRPSLATEVAPPLFPSLTANSTGTASATASTNAAASPRSASTTGTPAPVSPSSATARSRWSGGERPRPVRLAPRTGWTRPRRRSGSRAPGSLSGTASGQRRSRLKENVRRPIIGRPRRAAVGGSGTPPASARRIIVRVERSHPRCGDRDRLSATTTASRLRRRSSRPARRSRWPAPPPPGHARPVDVDVQLPDPLPPNRSTAGSNASATPTRRISSTDTIGMSDSR